MSSFQSAGRPTVVIVSVPLLLHLLVLYFMFQYIPLHLVNLRKIFVCAAYRLSLTQAKDDILAGAILRNVLSLYACP